MASILIVEDAPDVCEPLNRLLTEAGHDVVCVGNGREALRRVLLQLPDVVLLDLLTPEMDGPSFLEVVRSYMRLQSLPVVVLTALRDGPEIDRVREMNVSAVLLKGRASQQEILNAVEAAIQRPVK